MFNYKKFLRALPAAALQQHLSARGISVDTAFDWNAADTTFVRQFAGLLDRMDPGQRAVLIADWQEASDLADEVGCRAIHNACPMNQSLAPELREMASFEERALWVLRKHPKVFRRAIEIRFFDDNANKEETRRNKLHTTTAMSLAPDDLRALATVVTDFYRRNEGSGDHCEIEVTRRHVEGTVQLTLYIQDLVDSKPEFDENGQLQLRRRRPVMELALVYDPATSVAETVVRGGKKYHEMLLAAFVEHLLKVEVQPEMLQPQRFDMTRLRRGVDVRDAAALGIERIRLKRLVLESITNPCAILQITATAKSNALSANELAEQWFGAANPVWARFRIIQATIAIHFAPTTTRRRRTVYIDFRRSGTIKWDKMSEAERVMVERFLVEWGLVQDCAPPLSAAA